MTPFNEIFHQVGSGRADVWDDGRAASVRGWQRGRPLWVNPPRRRPLPGLAEQGGRLHPQRLHAEESQQAAWLCHGEPTALLTSFLWSINPFVCFSHIEMSATQKIHFFITFIIQAHGGEDAIKHHPFFRDVKWKELEERKVKPPFKPKFVSLCLSVWENTYQLTYHLAEEPERGDKFWYRIYKRGPRSDPREPRNYQNHPTGQTKKS